MPAPYSKDLREKALAAYNAGEGTQPEIARRFGIGGASVRRWRARMRDTGTVAAKTSSVRLNRRVLSEAGEAQLVRSCAPRRTPPATSSWTRCGMRTRYC